jgi:hypothetical protein
MKKLARGDKDKISYYDFIEEVLPRIDNQSVNA